MKGTVIKRGSRWSVVIDLGRDVDGKRIRKWHSGYRTKREAEQARIEILSRVQSGLYVAPHKLTVALSRSKANRCSEPAKPRTEVPGASSPSTPEPSPH
jgi:hypothetical protein